MLEVFLVSVCLSADQTCAPLSKAYYASRPYIAGNLKNARNLAVAYTGTWILYAAPAIALTRSEGRAQFRLAKYLTVQLRPDSSYLTFDMEF